MAPARLNETERHFRVAARWLGERLGEPPRHLTKGQGQPDVLGRSFMEKPTPYSAPHSANTFVRSLRHAWSGLIYVVKTQRNMRMHVVAGLLVAQVGQGVQLGLAEKVIMLFCVMLVFFAEMLNSALEQLVDLAVQQFDERAKLTKDIAAAGVLVLAIGTVTIFAAILVHNAESIFSNPRAITRQVMLGVPLTFLAGAMMHERPKPFWLVVVCAVLALGLWFFSLEWTESYVFWGMTFGLLIVTANVGWARKNETRHQAGS